MTVNKGGTAYITPFGDAESRRRAFSFCKKVMLLTVLTALPDRAGLNF